METTTEIIERIKADLALLEYIVTTSNVKSEETADMLQVFEPKIEYEVGQIGTICGTFCKVVPSKQCKQCIGCILDNEDCSNYLCTPHRGRKDKISIIFKPI